MSIFNLGFKNKAGECAKKIMGRNVFGLLNDYGNIPDPDFQYAKEQISLYSIEVMLTAIPDKFKQG